MTTDVTVEDVESAARELLENRISAVQALAEARQLRLGKRAELDTAERQYAAAFAAAERAGWSPEELKRVGLEAPDRRLPGRPRRARGGRARAVTASLTNGAAGAADPERGAEQAAPGHVHPG